MTCIVRSVFCIRYFVFGILYFVFCFLYCVFCFLYFVFVFCILYVVFNRTSDYTSSFLIATCLVSPISKHCLIPSLVALHPMFSCGNLVTLISLQTISSRSALPIAHSDPCACIASSLSLVCLLSLVAFLTNLCSTAPLRLWTS